jgi:hypothetical protein
VFPSAVSTGVPDVVRAENFEPKLAADFQSDSRPLKFPASLTGMLGAPRQGGQDWGALCAATLACGRAQAVSPRESRPDRLLERGVHPAVDRWCVENNRLEQPQVVRLAFTQSMRR